MGLEDLKIEDSRLSQSRGSGNTYPSCARLHNQLCGWCPLRGNGQFLQVELKHVSHITAIATQGFLTTKDYFVKKYKVSYSKDGKTWSYFPVEMIGNHDGISVQKHNFSSPINARFIRVHPIAHKGKICLRMELYGCRNPSSVLSATPSPTSQSGPNITTPNVPSAAASSMEKPMISTIEASSPPSTTPSPSPTTLSGANYTAPQNVTRVTAALSAENSTMIQSTTGQPIGCGNILTRPSEEHTGKLTAQMANDECEKNSSKPWFIAFVPIIIICLLLWFICVRKRTQNEMNSEEEVVESCGSSPEVTQTTEDGIQLKSFEP